MNSTDPGGSSRCLGILVTLWRYYYIIADAGGASPASARGLLRNLGERARASLTVSARGLCFYYKAKNIVYYDK